MLEVRFMLDNISLILISSSKCNNNWIEWPITFDWCRWYTESGEKSAGCSESHDQVSLGNSMASRLRRQSRSVRPQSRSDPDNRCWTTRSPSQVELDPKSSLPPLVGHAEPVVPYLISAYWTNLDHVIIQSTEEDVDRGKFANIPLQLHIKVLVKDRVLENVYVKWGIKRYVQNRQRA